MATTKRSRKASRKAVKIIAAAIILLAIVACRYPVPTATVAFGVLAVLALGRWRAGRPGAHWPPPQKRKADPDRKARDRGWVPPLDRNLVAVSRQCAAGQHILCATTECECHDCFSHDEEKIMKRNRDEYDARFPDEPPF